MDTIGFFKGIFRQVVFPSITLLHLEKLFSRLSHNNKLILVYHGVVSKPNPTISVGPLELRQFEKHLSYFANSFSVVPLTEIFDMYRSGHVPEKKTIAITFDDGYENNYLNVLPLLKKYKFPATIFVISQCLERPNSITWYDHFDLIRGRIDLDKLNRDASNSRQFKNTLDLRKAIKALNIKERQILFKRLDQNLTETSIALDYPEENWKLLNSEEIIELAKSDLIEIGAHSHNHPNLGELSEKDARDEIVTSKQMLESVLQKEVASFAFPDGSYNSQIKKLALDSGFKNLLALDYRCADDNTDKTILQRYCISSTTTFDSNMIQVNKAFSSCGF